MSTRFVNRFGFLTGPYLKALLAPAVVTGAMQATWPFFEPYPIVLYILAVVFCAWYDGIGPSLLCVVVSFLLSDFFFIEPYSLFQFHKQGDLVRVVLFAIIGLTISLLSELMHREKRRNMVNLNALRASEERYRKLTENFPNGTVITYDRDLRLTFIAGRGLQEVGLSPDHFLGKSLSEITPPEVFTLVEPQFQTAFGGQVVTYECPFPNGKTYFASVAPLQNGNGMINEILVISQDITQRKQVEQDLRASETKHRRLLDSSIVGVIFWNPEGEILYANDLFLSMTGYTREDLSLGRLSWKNITPPEYAHVDEQAISQLMATGTCSPFEKEYLRKDGSRVSVLIGSALLEGEKGTGSSFIMDITERKRSQESLNLFRNLIDQSSEAIEVIEPDTLRFLDCNITAHQTLGYTREDFLSLTAFDIDLVSDQATVAHLREELRKPPFVIFESVHRRKDGSTFPVEINAKTIHLERDYYVAMVRDITERKRAEDELRKQKEILQQIVDRIPVMINFTDSDGRIRLVNREWQQTLGWSLEEILREDLDVFAKCYPTPQARQDVLDFVEVADGEWRDFKTTTRDGRVIDTSWARVKLSDGTTIGIGQNVTARKQSEMALRQAERKYRDIFENAGEGIFQSTPDGRFLAANPALAHMYGFGSPEELIHSSPDASRQIYVDPTTSEDFKRQLDEQGALHGFECQIFRKDRSRIWISVNARAVGDEKGEIQYYEGTAQDITDRKRAEQALRDSEERYRDLVENSLDLICTHDLDGWLLSANRAAMELTGYGSGSYTGGINFRQILAPEVRDQFDDYLKLLRKDCVASGLMLVQTRSGEKRIWEYHSTLRTEGIAQPIVRGVARDVTERKRAAEALRESEERYRDLFENAKDAIYAQDLSGVYVSVNRAAERLSGYDRSEIIGKHFEQFLAPEYLPLACEKFSKKLDDKEQTSYEIEVIAKDGHRVPVELSSVLILKHGSPVGIQGIARDITERKRAEQALRSYSRQLIEAQEAERQQIARELHDQIGQVLTAIKINLHTVGQSCETEQSKSLVEQGVGLVDGAIEQVRDLSFELRPSLLDNLGLIAALRWYCDQYTRRTGIQTRSVSSLPKRQTRLRQELETACFRIVQEALTNVVRHAQANNVVVDLAQVDHQIVLSIKDDGIGFIGKTNGGAATSLGLQGMKERALALGGTLTIASGPAEGTEIRASFPTRSKEE